MLIDTNVVSNFISPDAEQRCPKLVALLNNCITVAGLSISFVTYWELRRGMEALVRRGQGQRKVVQFEKFIERIEILGLDDGGGEGWGVAARLWADARAIQPAHALSDADLMIAATAVFHDRPFATGDVKLAAGLKRLALPIDVLEVPSH